MEKLGVKAFGDTDRIMTIGGWKKAEGKIIFKDNFIHIRIKSRRMCLSVGADNYDIPLFYINQGCRNS